MSSKLTAVGHHCYFGGFLLGLQAAGVEIKATRETWKPGGLGSRALGLPVSLEGEPWNPRHADLVVANPPCSRFSVLSQAFYTNEQKSDCGCFAELRELDATVKSVKPRLFWWETGPMARSTGMPLLHQNHAHVRDELMGGKCTTIIIYYDTRYSGFPQRRPRTHIMHFRGKVKPPAIRPPKWPNDPQTMGSFFVKQLGRNPKFTAPVIPGIFPTPFNKDSTSKLCKLARVAKGTTPTKFYQWACSPLGIRFDSGRPNVVDDSDRFAPSLLGIHYIRRPDDRWMDLSEAAAIMGFPVKKVMDYHRSGVLASKVQLLLSKGLCPDSSRFLAQNVVEPILCRDVQEYEGADARHAKSLGDGIYYYDLTVGDSYKRNASESTRKLVLMRATDVVEKGDPSRFHGTALRHSKHHHTNQ